MSVTNKNGEQIIIGISEVHLAELQLENTKIAVTTLADCLQEVAVLASKNECFIDEVPEILKEDFNNFIIGHTLSSKENRLITYDMKMYFEKIINKGFDYPIRWMKKY